MPIFQPLDIPHHWQPQPLAAGPFTGLQGGAVASLLTAEIEAVAADRQWGRAVSVTAHFLRPTPMAWLRTKQVIVTEGGRVSVVDNTLWAVGEAEPCATARVTLVRERGVEVPGLTEPRDASVDPTCYPARAVRAAHGGPWFMDAMEARAGDGVAWFRLDHDIIEGAGALSRVLGPADWSHGVARPLQNVVADPNPNLTVQLFKRPVGPWIGVRARTWWQPAAGLGTGQATLLDIHGEIGCVSMAVVLVPFPKPAPAMA
ncbi:acyl-CoA thioesterase domain-containing protein [Bradyrhizobium prioriisuperbiae]|uniref:acyl-CoA thioesterase domain-containing protein n=1 Tax=Bradyrhizobium prioriisuperbiae TaxID=2854389 RepID=UPI0028E4ACDE|nr:acyl-CoA thioesterase domain-containing protein [Bradyrhizobium prioritasuperba]